MHSNKKSTPLECFFFLYLLGGYLKIGLQSVAEIILDHKTRSAVDECAR